MRIAQVEVVAAHVSPPAAQAALRALRGEWVFIRVVAENGTAGLGEATHSGDDDALAGAVREGWSASLIGREVDPGRATDAIGRVLAAVGPGTARLLEATLLSAVEQALWDLAARALDCPLYEALGGPRQTDVRVPLYATLNRGIFDRSPQGFAAAAAQAKRDGFRAMKCAPFDGVTRGEGPSAARDAAIELGIERVAAVRQAVGPEVGLMVDCHGRFWEAEAVAVGRRLERFGLRWIEEPVTFEPDAAPLARVRRAVPMPVAAGELLFGAEGFQPLLEAGAVDVIMPDVKHCGGLTAAWEIAQLAAEYGVTVAPHNPSGPISTLASAHLCAALENAPLLEYAWGEVPWRASLLAPEERIVDGTLALPSGAGLGATLAPAVLVAHAHPL